MKFSPFLSILPFLTGATALPADKKTGKGFSVVAINPGSPVHNLKLDASSTLLYLNSETNVWCPPEVVKASNCPGGNTTIRDTPVLASANYMVCLIQLVSRLHSKLNESMSSPQRSPVANTFTLTPTVTSDTLVAATATWNPVPLRMVSRRSRASGSTRPTAQMAFWPALFVVEMISGKCLSTPRTLPTTGVWMPATPLRPRLRPGSLLTAAILLFGRILKEDLLKAR